MPHHSSGLLVLRRRFLLIAVLVLAAGCAGKSGYADVPLAGDPRPATVAQQQRYGVPAGTLVLLELLPTSYRHETGPAGAFRFRPYQIIARCQGHLQIHENREYGGDQGEGVGSPASCTTPMNSGFQSQPARGSKIVLVVIDSDNPLWGVLVVAKPS